jgi:outer membrane murein-binding lipoprotein Lpp
MPLSQAELEALDPSDPADAAILQEEALAYLASTESLSTDVTDLQAEVATVEQEAQDTSRRLYAATVYPKRESQGLKLARGLR